MVALLSAVALAVDVGMLVTARTEAQVVADASALAGASVFQLAAGTEDEARDRAILWAAENEVRGVTVEVLPEDVDVDVDERTVRVRVHRTRARDSAVPTYFARVFGVSEVDISTSAAAWAAPASHSGGDENAHCMLPVALVDDFIDVNGNGVFDDGDLYDPDNGIGGYDTGDHGKLIRLKIHSNNEETGPPACQSDATNPDVSNSIDYCQDGGDSSAWRCWWRESEQAGGGSDVLGDRIYPGNDCGPEMARGDTVWEASGGGNKQSLVHYDEEDPKGNFESLIRSEPDLVWCDECDGGNGCVVDAVVDPDACFEGQSGRVRTAPVVDPTIDAGGSHTHSVINDFIGVFVEQVSCAYDVGPFQTDADGRWNVYVRLMVTGGGGSTGDEGGSDESLIRNLQLIE
jgi:hypothetical protein